MDNYIQLDKEDEISGSLTFAKYWYQYNWALIKFLEESEDNNECSLSIECHEDVMIIDKMIKNK
ncbi:dsDNA nuclease domain-containing protein [Vibrio lentus]|nr:dsDNA nuclease domain-containing protein [Vibrio lentus]